MRLKSQGEPDEMELFLGKDVTFEGKLTFKGMARLDGTFDGEILSGGELIVGEGAVINAEIKVDTLIIQGQVNGNVSTKVKTLISATGKLTGDVDTPAFVIEEGGLFNGTSNVDKGKVVVAQNVSPMRSVDAPTDLGESLQVETAGITRSS